MIKSGHNGFKVMYMHMSIFFCSQVFYGSCDQVFQVLLIFQWYSVLWVVKEIYVPLGVIYVTINKKEYF